MSDQHRGGAWGSAENAVWWPNANSDQSNLQQHHQQLLNQHHQQQNHLQQQQIHQVVVQQQQTQALSDVSRSNSTTSVASQQLFSYKMASSFPSGGVPTSSAYDYRLGMGTQSGMPTNPGTQWWYTTAGQNALENLQQQQVTQSQVQHQNQTQIQQHQTQNIQNIHNVHSNTTPNQQTHVQQNVTQNNQIAAKMGRGKAQDAKPRGRMTAYAFFVQTCREEHKKKHPEESVIFAEFSRKCAERWKTMLDKEKKRFHEMAEKDKQRYEMEMSNYVPPKGVTIGRGKKRKQVKDPNAPKRSLSAFFWFCHDERNKVKALNPEYGVGDIAKELGRKWSDCDAEVKSKYEAMADKDKQRYEKEMGEYKLKCRNMQQGIVTPNHIQQQAQQQMQQQQMQEEEEDDDEDGED